MVITISYSNSDYRTANAERRLNNTKRWYLLGKFTCAVEDAVLTVTTTVYKNEIKKEVIKWNPELKIMGTLRV